MHAAPPGPGSSFATLGGFPLPSLEETAAPGDRGDPSVPGPRWDQHPRGIRGYKAFGSLEGPARGRVAPAHGLGRVQSAAMATASDAHRGGTGPGTQ